MNKEGLRRPSLTRRQFLLLAGGLFLRIAKLDGDVSADSGLVEKEQQVETLIRQGKVFRELSHPLLVKGEILPKDQIFFADRNDLLPIETYDNTNWVLENKWGYWFPASITKPQRIVVHNDSIAHDFGKDSFARMLEYPEETKYYLLLRGVSVHFTVSPIESVQMLPMGKEWVTRSFSVYDLNTGTISIETTGLHFHNLPPEKLTSRTVDLTINLMKEYSISFPQILGHMECAKGDNATDPGFAWLWHFRSRLYQAMEKDLFIKSNWNYFFPEGCKIKDDLGHAWDSKHEIEKTLRDLKNSERLERNFRRLGID